MSVSVIIDWKTVVALCVGICLIKLTEKVDGEAAGGILTQFANVPRDYAIAISNR